MGGASAFIAMLAVGGFFCAIWTASRISRLLQVSSIVLEILTGLVLSPSMPYGGLMPGEYSKCIHTSHIDCETRETLNHIASLDLCRWEVYQKEDGYMGGRDASGLIFKGIVSDGNVTDGHDGHGHDGHAAHTTAAPHAGHDHTTADPHSGHDHTTADPHGGAHDHTTADPSHGHDHTTVDPSHGDDHTTADPSHGDDHTTADSGHGDDHTTADPAHGDEHTTADPAHGHDDATADPSHGHGETTEDPTHSNGHETTETPGARRLSGHADKAEYASYEECLENQCIMELSHECSLTPDIFTFVGHTGVALMIFESGMHFDFEKAKTVGPWACVVAVVGTILPLATGSLLAMLFGFDIFPDGVSAGTALAPTSVGIALKLLHEAKQLQSDFGQAIITAAFVDDILSLILFNILFGLGDGEFSFTGSLLPNILGILFMLFATVLAVKFWPRAIGTVMNYVPPKKNQIPGKTTNEEECLFIIMVCLLLIYASLTYLAGTHLWGCFIAGMSFALVHTSEHKHAHDIWVRQTGKITVWMIRIFFACTVAFAIPLDALFSIAAFWKGAIMGIGPCILTKVVCAPFMGPPRFVIGWAMVGRAEFAYLIAQMAAASNMMDKDLFAICIWALLWATVWAPFIFRYVLKKYGEKLDREECEARGETWDPKEYKERMEKRQQDEAIRASGHLPTHEELAEHDDESKPFHSVHTHHEAHGHHPTKDFAANEHGENPVQDIEVQKLHVAPAVDHKDMSGAAAAPAGGAAARGSGFLCCLFFKKIAVM